MNCRTCSIELTKETLCPCKDYPSGYRTICRRCYNNNQRRNRGLVDKNCLKCNKKINSITEKIYCSADCRFHDSYIKQEDGCWIWKKTITLQDQPFFNFKSRRFQARRYVLGIVELTEVGKDIVVYTCDSNLCVNPEHLEMSTAAKEQSKRRTTLSKKQIETFKKYTVVTLDGDEAMQRLLDEINKTLGE